MTRNFHDTLSAWLQRLPRSRELRTAIPRSAGHIEVNGRLLVDFSSNDYLGLSHHPRLIQAIQEWAGHGAAGATASRLITGNHPACATIEQKIARLTGMPAALLMNSGFTANSTVLAALLDRRLHGGRSGQPAVSVFVDRLVHASIHFGLAAAGIRQQRFRHNDLDHLEQLLRADRDQPGCRMIVTESVFSMEGDTSDIAALRQIADRYDALLYIDEAHAMGVLGPGGGGLSATTDCVRAARQELVVGTFGKALGSCGAFVASSETIRQYLINCCSGLIYATALPPPVLGAIDAALDLIPDRQAERDHLQRLARQFRQQLSAAGLDTRRSTTHIVPVMTGNDDATLAAAEALRQAGFQVSAIRPPTVPPGTSRLRVSFSAAHRLQQVDALASAIIQVFTCQTVA